MIGFILKATIALLVFYAFYHAFMVKESMFGFNRFYLIFALCFSLIVPFIQMPFSFQITENLIPEKSSVQTAVKEDRSQEEVPAQQPAWEQVEMENPLQTQPITSVNWNNIFMGIYLLGLTLFLTRYILQLVKLIRLIRSNLTLRGNECTYVLLLQKSLPFTYLNFLFVEKESFQKKAIEKEILFHELAHIRQKHSWDILFVEFLRSVFWFNPLLLLYKKAIQLNHEFLADAAVNSRFQDKAVYQWLLFNKFCGKEAGLSISSPFNFSSTKSRLIMMGKSSSSLKTNLLKSISILIAGFLMVFLSSSQPFESTQFQSSNDYEQILSMAFKEGNPFELNLNKLDLPALRRAYLAMDGNEKYEVTEFPFFDELTFEKLVELQQAYPTIKTSILFENPPEKKELENEVFEEWKQSKNISLNIDDKEKEVADLNEYQPDDFALFIVRGTENKGLFKKAAYSVTLMTHEYYYGKYYKSQKKIHLIQAEYPNADKVRVNYWLKHAETKDGKVTKLLPENYEASIFHHLRVLDTTQLDLENKLFTKYDSQKSFPVVIFSSDGKQVTLLFLPSIE
jgi:beta-lactamase regulating signal transducer with metallopeptidase domain